MNVIQRLKRDPVRILLVISYVILLHLAIRGMRWDHVELLPVEHSYQYINERSQDETSVPFGSGGGTTTTTTTIYPDPEFREEMNVTQQQRFQNSIRPWPNVSTVGFLDRRFYAGYRNQVMTFIGFLMFASRENHSQILLPTLRHMDFHGTEELIPHEFLFDVEHWNSFYPQLPRMVSCDSTLFDQFDCVQNDWKSSNTTRTRPYGLGTYEQCYGMYHAYNQRMGPFATPDFPHRVDKLILSGALQPHPDLRDIVKKYLHSIIYTNQTTTTTTSSSASEYMALHARVEPDMQRHIGCPDKKVPELKRIFKLLEAQFPDPPAMRLFLPINRNALEQEAYIDPSNLNGTNWVAVRNIIALDRAVKRGLWAGRVQVFECGAKALEGTKYERLQATTGSMIDFYLAFHAKLFVGTEVSSFSADLVKTRFYAGNKQNYMYRPHGIDRWTTDDMMDPPGFEC